MTPPGRRIAARDLGLGVGLRPFPILPPMLSALGFLIALRALPAGPGLHAEPLGRDALAAVAAPPMSLGEPAGDGVRELLSSGGAPAGSVLGTESPAPIPGVSGAPLDLLVAIDVEGRVVDVRLISRQEPIFVSGRGRGRPESTCDAFTGG